MQRFFIFLGIFLAVFHLPVHAAGFETVVVGQVLNSLDKSPMAGVNISFKNSTSGVRSNEEGYFLIRTSGNYNVLVFSSVGFKKQEIHVKPGQSAGLQVELVEENTLLREVFVVPGVNPALELMKKVRLLRKENDIIRHPGFSARSTEQNLVMLNKFAHGSVNKRIFDQLRKSSLANHDSLLVPLYMSEKTFLVAMGQRHELSKNIFQSPVDIGALIEKLLGQVSNSLDFYDNAVLILGKSMVSPLANVGNAYYSYFLADSLKTNASKQYVIHFRTRNPRNLAFNGKLTIDSATCALTGIEVELPPVANINFVHNLHISQQFSNTPDNRWLPKSSELALSMNYGILADSLQRETEILLKQTAVYQYDDSIEKTAGNFAQTNYSDSILNARLEEMTNTPLLRTAKWLSDIILTGYVPVGKIDVGKIQQFIRITGIEGFRATLPLRTNERLWKNISLGGYVGYGFRNETFKYSGFAQFRLPGNSRRVLSLAYTDDYRRVNYNYDNFMYLENPLVTGDVDISNTVLSLASAGNMNERHELSLSLSNDWNKDVESALYVRSNRLFGNGSLPLLRNGSQAAPYLDYQFATLSTRVSFDEKTYEDHTQRIYIDNKKPEIYGIIELGKYRLGDVTGTFGKIMAKMNHSVIFSLAEMNYMAEAGLILGKVPYPLLEIPANGGGYSLYYFGMMNFMEYVADKYVNVHGDITFNGLLLNQLPLLKYLKMREMCSLNFIYGQLDSAHRTVVDLPQHMNPLSKPYVEVGVGFSNILHLFTLQSVWRLTDLDHPGAQPWGLRASVKISL